MTLVPRNYAACYKGQATVPANKKRASERCDRNINEFIAGGGVVTKLKSDEFGVNVPKANKRELQ